MHVHRRNRSYLAFQITPLEPEPLKTKHCQLREKNLLETVKHYMKLNFREFFSVDSTPAYTHSTVDFGQALCSKDISLGWDIQAACTVRQGKGCRENPFDLHKFTEGTLLSLFPTRQFGLKESPPPWRQRGGSAPLLCPQCCCTSGLFSRRCSSK